MGLPEHPESGAPSRAAEIHALHRRLALALGALAGLLLFVRGPGGDDGGSQSASGDGDSDGASEAEASRSELDAGIDTLRSWLERGARPPRDARDTNQRLLALGRATLDADMASIAASLERLKTPRPAPPAPDASAAATLAILLEAGTPLGQQLPLPSGPLTLAELLDLALPDASGRAMRFDPWSLDLLSFAVLAGKTEPREALARRAYLSLLELDREQRLLSSAAGSEHAGEAATSLQLGASVFRAIAVLAEPELEQHGLRYLNALLRQQPLERRRRRDALARSKSEPERVDLHVQAVGTLGLLEQALFGAHLAFRSGEAAAPAPRAASVMRRAAAELLEHLQALEGADALASGSASGASPELLWALTRALRGLRAARIAT